MNENKFVKFILVSITIFIISLVAFIVFLFTSSFDKISNSFNSFVSTISADTKELSSDKPTDDKVTSAISNTVTKNSALDPLFDQVGEMSEEQYNKNVEILLSCGIDNIKKSKVFAQTDNYTSYRIYQDTVKYVVLDIYFSKTNDIIKILHYDTTLYDNGQVFYKAEDFVIPQDTLALYKNAILEMTKREYESTDVDFYTVEYTPYYVVDNPDLKQVTVYGQISIKDKNLIKKFEAKFTGDTMDTITFLNYTPK